MLQNRQKLTSQQKGSLRPFLKKTQRPIACIVIPTYNESLTIVTVLDLIFRYESAQPPDHLAPAVHVLVVDDNSPDGTASLVEQYQRKNSRVHLLKRPKKAGLGTAYIAGMTYAMATINPAIILEMDADLSHNPADIFRLLAAVRKGADFVIGSRYVRGGSVPSEWGLHRKLLSSASNFLARIILQSGSIRDCTGGFRAIRASVIKAINLHALDVKGYAFQALLLDGALRIGASIEEIPIAFFERHAGKSKMTFGDVFEGAVILLRLRLRHGWKRQHSPFIAQQRHTVHTTSDFTRAEYESEWS